MKHITFSLALLLFAISCAVQRPPLAPKSDRASNFRYTITWEGLKVPLYSDSVDSADGAYYFRDQDGLNWSVYSPGNPVFIIPNKPIQ